MKDFLFKIVPFFLFFSLYAETTYEPLSSNTTSTPTSQKKLLNSNALVSELEKIKNLPNLLKSARELKYINKNLKGKLFNFKGTVFVKRDELISGDRVLWFTFPKKRLEARLLFSKETNEPFELINEHDYITARVKFIKVSEYLEFEFIHLNKLEPFNPTGSMLNFSSEFSKFKILRSNLKFTSYKEELEIYSAKKHSSIGFLSGVVSNISFSNGNYLMTMTVNDFTVTIKCHPKYTEFLADLDMQTKVTMVALLENINAKNEASFFRGCMTNWIEP